VGIRLKRFFSNFTIKQIIYSLITIVSLLLFLVLTIWSHHLTSQLSDQRAAQRWDKDGKSVQVSCYFTDKVKLIYCGGSDPIAAAREQWNDGSNTLCVAPGKIIVYRRNDVTNDILRGEGLTVLEMPSAELSRGRGGPRCMSMPLIRAE